MANQLRGRHDIIINGGGIVGFTLLNLILKSPQLSRCKVLLIEQASKPTDFKQPPRQNNRDKVFSNRVSSITSASRAALEKLGVWDTVKDYSKNVKRIKVWNYDYSHKIVFKQTSSDCNHDRRRERDSMFSTVENNRLSSALLENLHNLQSGAESIAWSSSLERMEESSNESGMVDITLKSSNTGEESTISAPLVLGCDGFKSKVRGLAQMKYRECDLKKVAVVGTVRMSPQITQTGNDVAFQRFSAGLDTVAALLPLDKDFSSFVVSAPNDYAKHLIDCDDETFVNELNQLLATPETPKSSVLKCLHEVANTTYDSLQGLLTLLPAPLKPAIDLSNGFDQPPSLESVIPNSRASFPLIFGTTSPNMISSLPGLMRPQIALLGDASHRIHPLAGQGLNLGIQDATELVHQLETIAKTGEPVLRDPSQLSRALRRYELKRQAFVMPMSAGILAMQDLFKLAPSRLISSVNKCNPIKNISVRVANGV